ncbi:hypothetical protein Tco_0922366 [Tanacetum coccineum]|uniref:Uncharacterized protein n=1 Tax=Tanacetum coccineum TaxID=301880 RepID=A0ABQ5CZE2_9ASTR
MMLKMKGGQRKWLMKKRRLRKDMLSTDGVLNADKEKVSTDKEKAKVSSVRARTSQAKAVSREKEKGVELREVKDAERPRPTSQRSLLTLKPLPKIDPKDKGKKKILTSDDEMARKIQEEWEAEDSRTEFLAEKLQEQEREQFTIGEEQYEDFIAIGSVEDDRLIKRMNKKDSSKGEEIKQESKEEVKEEDKGEENTSFDKVLWEISLVMFNPDEQDEFWNSQHEWKVVSWKLRSSSGVHTLMTDEGLVVHMLIEKKYPLKKGNTDANAKAKFWSLKKKVPWH